MPKILPSLIFGAASGAAYRYIVRSQRKKRNENLNGQSVLVGVGSAALFYGVSSLISGQDNRIPDTGNSQNTPPSNQGTFPAIWYRSQADALYTAFWGSIIYEDDQAIERILKMVNNIADVNNLIAAYGIRGTGILIRDEYNLPQTITRYLDDSNRAEVNRVYNEKGINFQW
jgi:hypothetical protein